VPQLVQALRYNPGGRGFDSRCCHPSGRTMALGSTQHLTEMSKISPITGLEWPRGFQEVKFPRFRDNGTGWW